MPHIFVSNHGADSMRIRLNVSAKHSDKQALAALDKGLPREETGGGLRRWIDSKYFNYERDHKYLIWRNFLWIFGDSNVLITCYPIPGNLAKDVCTQREKWEKRRSEPLACVETRP